MSDTCRSCPAPVLWLRHAVTGKRAPIDQAPAPDGNIVVDETDGTYLTLNAAQRNEVRERGGELHLNHFVTCPQAASWKGRAATTDPAGPVRSPPAGDPDRRATGGPR